MPMPAAALPTLTTGSVRMVPSGVSAFLIATMRTQKRVIPATHANALSTWSASAQSSKLTKSILGRAARDAACRALGQGLLQLVVRLGDELFCGCGTRHGIGLVQPQWGLSPAICVVFPHFFGSNQQLFVPAVGLPFNPGEMLPAILAGDPTSIGERLAALLVEVLEEPELHRRLTGVVRAAASEPEVARMLREFLTRELFGPAAEILGADDGPFRANLVGSQIVGLVMARYVVAIEPLASMPPKAIAAAVAPTLQRYLLGPLGQDKG